MRPIWATLAALCLLALTSAPGCGGSAPAPVEQPAQKQPAPGPVAGNPPGKLPALDPAQPPVQTAAYSPEPTKDDKYQVALNEAFDLLSQRKYPEALASLEAARTFKDSDFLRAEIDKLRARVEQQSSADKTVQDIQTVLEQGKVAEASQLATAALQQYGASDAAPRLAKLKVQADALSATQMSDNGARHKRFRDEGEAALRDRNLRAAALAFEQALTYADDANLRQQLTAVRGSLSLYDECRTRAAELRRDPAALDDALAQLQEAAKAWDTLQVRQEIDEYTLALQKRRERVSVAEFEVRGDIGIAEAGRVVAEELLPHLKPKYDLVERGQLAKVLVELKLSAARLAESPEDQREAGRLAKVRYLVVGSVSQLGGVAVNARLVDVRTGLIVQTAKVVAPTPEQAVALIPELAKLLLMTDEQRMAYEQDVARTAKVEALPAQLAPPPPPPEPPVANAPPPPPILVSTAAPPALGGVVFKDFERLPPPPPQMPPVQFVEVVPPQEVAVRQRMLAVSLELGDNLFRRGRFHEARRHFEFGLTLAPGHFDLRLRLDRTRPLLPPPPVVLVAPPPPRPRVAVLDFVTEGDPRVVPPGLSSWAPQHLAPYFCPPYEVVDRGEVFWWMGRLNMSLRDLMTDPAARRWLGRALDVRYFVLGTIRQTASFDVTTYLIDAEHGYLVSSGRVHVRDPFELKLRLPELARLTLMSPEERLRYQQQSQPFDGLLVKARASSERGEFSVAVGLFQQALKLRPGSVEIQFHLSRTDRAAEVARLEEARRREQERLRLEAEAFQRRQFELARLAEAARVRAAEEAALRADADRRLFEERRHAEQGRAHGDLLVRARVAFKGGDFRMSVQIFESALGVRQSDDVYRELALARAELERVSRLRESEQQTARAAEEQRRREDELLQARLRLEDERRRRQEEELARRREEERRDLADYQRLFDEGQRLLAKDRHDGAIEALQAARRLRRTGEVEALLNQAMVGQAKARATAQGEKARQELERQLAEERERRVKAEADAKRNQDLYAAALRLAQQALAERNYDLATAKYQEAGRVFRTDVVLTGLRQAEAARAKARAESEAARLKQQAAEQRAANLKRLLGEGQAALAAKDYDKAVRSYGEAKKVAPDSVEALTGLAKAEETRERLGAEAKRRQEEQDRQATFRKLVEAGQANLASKQYDAAVLTLTEALKLKPGDGAASRLKEQAEKARQAATVNAAAAAEAAKKAEAYQRAMTQGRVALETKRYEVAIKSFEEAQKILPGDQSSAGFLKDAQKAKGDAAAAIAAEAQRKADEAQRAATLQKALTAGRSALAAGNLKAAGEAAAAAAKASPKDAAVLALQDDLRKAERAAQTAAAEAQKQKQAAAQRAEQIRQHLSAGRAAIKAGQFDAASRSIEEARKLAPADGDVSAALRELDQARRGAAARADQAKAQAAYRDAIQAGQKALDAKRYDEAVQRFTEAGKLLPGDAAAGKLLQQATQARTAAQAADAAARQRAERVQQLVMAASAAIKSRQFDAAAKSINEARTLAPQDPSVARAQQDLDQARRAAGAEAEKAKRQADYNTAIKAGQAALGVKRYDEAIQRFAEAGKLMPGDANAAALQRQAEQARAAAQAADMEARKRAERVQQLVKATQDAIKARQFEAAAKSLNEARTLAPQDPNVQRVQQELDQARRNADADAQKAKRQASYQEAIKNTQQALSGKRYDDAIKAANEALKQMPGDAPASALLKQAEKARADARAAQEAEAKQRAAEKQRQAEYQRLMDQGRAATAAKRHAEAVKAYTDALKVMPNEAAATQALRQAQEALSAASRPPAPPAPSPQVKTEYDKQMASGAALEQQQKHAEAATAYEAALKAIPKDAKASEGYRRAKYTQHMTEGNSHLNARRFAEAVRQFEAALQVTPNDPAATEALKRAKAGRP